MGSMSNNVIQLTSKFVKLSMIKSVTVLSLHTEVLEVLVDVEVTLVDVEVQEDLLSLVMALLLPLHVDLYHDRSAKTYQDSSNVPRQECRNVPKQQCNNVPIEQCNNV